MVVVVMRRGAAGKVNVSPVGVPFMVTADASIAGAAPSGCS